MADLCVFTDVRWRLVGCAGPAPGGYVDRIEVIRGPGGTLWGANAVNGVINIITKEASKTQEALVATSAGADEGYAACTEIRGKEGANFAYRIYGTSNDWLPEA